MSKLAIALAMSAMALGLAVSAAPAPARAQSEAATVRQLYDKELILDMMARYCFALDDADGATYAAMFTQDGVLISGNGANVQKGRAAIKAYVDGRKPAPGAPSAARINRHAFHNAVVDINGDRATVRAYWTTTSSAGGGAPALASMGRYQDTLVKRNGKWLWTERRITTDMTAAPAAAPAR